MLNRKISRQALRFSAAQAISRILLKCLPVSVKDVDVYTIYLSEDSKTKLDAIISMQKLQPASGRSAVIEKAIDFYFGFLSSQLSMDYLCGVFGKQIEATVNNAASRLSSIQFKQAVETNLLTRICALDYNLSTDEYSKMRSKAVDAVKKSNGRIGLFDTVNESDLD